MIAEMSVAPDGKEIMVSTGDEKTLVFPTSGEMPGTTKTLRPVSPEGHVASDAQYLPDGSFNPLPGCLRWTRWLRL
jgi:hypothetical protein